MATQSKITKEEISIRLRRAIQDALAVGDAEIKEDAVLTRDLGADSIDYLDIAFRTGKKLGINTCWREFYPEDIIIDTRFCQAGQFTPEGVSELHKKWPWLDLAEIDRDPHAETLMQGIKVSDWQRYLENKAREAGLLEE